MHCDIYRDRAVLKILGQSREEGEKSAAWRN